MSPTSYSWQRIAEELGVSEPALIDLLGSYYCEGVRIALSRVLMERNR